MKTMEIIDKVLEHNKKRIENDGGTHSAECYVYHIACFALMMKTSVERDQDKAKKETSG